MYTGCATPGTLEAWTSLAAVMRPDTRAEHRRGQPARARGASSPTASTDAPARGLQHERRAPRGSAPAGSRSASGAAKRAPVNRLPPCGSSWVRRLIGMPTGIVVAAPRRRAPRGSAGTRRARRRGTRRSAIRRPPSPRLQRGERHVEHLEVPLAAARSQQRRAAGGRARRPHRATGPPARPARGVLAGRASAPNSPAPRRSASDGAARTARGDLAGEQPDRGRRARPTARGGLRPSGSCSGVRLCSRAMSCTRRARRWRCGG